MCMNCQGGREGVGGSEGVGREGVGRERVG